MKYCSSNTATHKWLHLTRINLCLKRNSDCCHFSNSLDHHFDFYPQQHQLRLQRWLWLESADRLHVSDTPITPLLPERIVKMSSPIPHNRAPTITPYLTLPTSPSNSRTNYG